MKGLLLLIVAALAVGGWFAPQMQEGTEGPCPALEKKLRATRYSGSAASFFMALAEGLRSAAFNRSSSANTLRA